MAIDRRSFLVGAAAGSTLALGDIAAAAPAGRPDFVSALGDRNGRFHVSGMDRQGRTIFDLPLPGRGHGAVLDPSGLRVIVFGRRPRTFAVAIDLKRGTVETTFYTPTGRHFFGHGAFSPDGNHLYASENDFDGQLGVIGVYEVYGKFRRIGEVPSYGVGPHEVRMMPDGVTLAVANGGILTHPDMPRVKLNIPTMKPNLALIDRRTGALRRKTELPPEMHRASIRHLAMSPGGQIAIGMQYQGPRSDRAPVVAIVASNGDVRMGNPAHGASRSMRQYCGSIEFDKSGTVIAASAPRGNVVTFWDANRCRPIGSVTCIDACGIAPLPEARQFLITSGRGAVLIADLSDDALRTRDLGATSEVRWDNHLVPLS